MDICAHRDTFAFYLFSAGRNLLVLEQREDLMFLAPRFSRLCGSRFPVNSLFGAGPLVAVHRE